MRGHLLQGATSSLASGRAALCLAACLACAAGAARADGWCDVVFKDVAREAGMVLLVRVERVPGAAPQLRAVEALKGSPGSPTPGIAREALERSAVKDGDHLLLALDGQGRLEQQAHLGLCDPISVLPIRKGRLRAHDRARYDGGSAALPLETLLAELRALASTR